MSVDREAFRDPYRVRCPRGHRNLRAHQECRTAYCNTCRRTYAFGELADARADA